MMRDDRNDVMRDEPFIAADDVRVWNGWCRTFALHAKTRHFHRAVDDARRIAGTALEKAMSPMVAWSGGKDSTALAHLIRVGLGADVAAVSEKDDLDYPGEEAYVRGLAEGWALQLEIVRPPVSPTAWLLERRGFLSAGEDMHSRTAGLSKACFYGVMDHANSKHDVMFWGLRADESKRRRALLTSKGPSYQLRGGQKRSAPLARWSGLDVFAYLQLHGIEPLPVYRCCGFLPEHRRQPWLIRKSWWIPGAHAKHGWAAWLRRYWPSLFERLREVTFDVRSYS